MWNKRHMKSDRLINECFILWCPSFGSLLWLNYSNIAFVLDQPVHYCNLNVPYTFPQYLHRARSHQLIHTALTIIYFHYSQAAQVRVTCRFHRDLISIVVSGQSFSEIIHLCLSSELARFCRDCPTYHHHLNFIQGYLNCNTYKSFW